MANDEIDMTLDEAVAETLGLLTGLDLTYDSSFDRYRAITRALNRALRANALEREWSYYSSSESLGLARAGEQDVSLRGSVRPRIIGDDSVRLVDQAGRTLVWAYFLPRDAIEKYPTRRGLWVSISRQSLHFSRPFSNAESGLEIFVPVMREPKMFRLPAAATTADDEEEPVPDSVRNQLLDFSYPDAIIARAAYFYAQTDPVMQPRVQTLEAEYKTIFYALNERDDQHTDAPFLNEFAVPIQGGLNDSSWQDMRHPHADDRY